MINEEMAEISRPIKKFNGKYLLYFLLFSVVESIGSIVAMRFISYDPELPLGEQAPNYILIWFISKLLPLIVIAFILYKVFSENGKKVKKNFLKFILTCFVAFLIFYAAEIGTSLYTEWIGSESQNQNSILELFNPANSTGIKVLLFITIVILAPLLEEFEYRELIFKTFEGCHFAVPLFISATLFAGAHLLSVTTLEELINELKFFPVYFIPGLLLGLTYHYSNNNVFASFLVHMTSNLLSYMAIVQQMNLGQ